MIQKEIKKQLKKAIRELGVSGDIGEPQVEAPADASHGDYSTNVAMIAFAKIKSQSIRQAQDKKSNLKTTTQNSKFKTPLEIAQEIASILNTKYKIHNTDRVKAVAPGFINFWLSQEYLSGQLNEVLEKKEKFGSNDKLKGQKVMLEFADPNPFKEFHVGHLRNISLGESFSRLLEGKGAQVWRVNYQGDVGMHVAKALYGLLQISNLKSQISNIDQKELQDKINEIDKKPLKDKIKILGEAYVIGSNAYDTIDAAKAEIQSINIKVYQMNESVKKLWDMGKAWSLEHFEQIYNRVGTIYKHYYFESATVELAKELVTNSIQKDIFEASDGAIVFRGEKMGLHTRVFLTKEGYPTYEGKDMALATLKQRDLDYDESIIITAHEQAQYFQVILAALRLVFPDLAAKTVHYSFGFVSLKEGKMSSRKGNVIAGEWLLDEAKQKILKAYKEMDDKTAEKVAVGAVKYSMLKFAPASDIHFSFDESISLEGNSGPYLQYTYARTQSVLSKVKIQSIRQAQDKKSNLKNTNQNSKLELNNEEKNLVRSISKFPEVVDKAGEEFAPNLLCNYLFDLAQQFNLFYQKHQIIPGNVILSESEGSNHEGDSSATPQNDNFRLRLTQAVGQVLKNGLYLLGIEAPEKM